MHAFLERAHVAEELAGAENGHAALALFVLRADFHGASHHDEAGARGLAGSEDPLSGRKLEDAGELEDLGDLASIEAFEDGQVRQEGLEVEGGNLAALHAGERIGAVRFPRRFVFRRRDF